MLIFYFCCHKEHSLRKVFKNIERRVNNILLVFKLQTESSLRCLKRKVGKILLLQEE
jgi:hypothetical protein